MKEVIMELEILYNKMEDINRDIENEAGNEEIPFGKVLCAVMNRITKSDLFEMNNQDLIKHIQKIQIIES